MIDSHTTCTDINYACLPVPGLGLGQCFLSDFLSCNLSCHCPIQCFPVPPFSSSFRSVPFLKTRTAQIVPFRSVPSVPTVGRNGTERNGTMERKNRPFQIKIENFPI